MRSSRADAQELSESMPLPDFGYLLLIMNNSQKNNGSQLILITYMFFETIVEHITHQQQTFSRPFGGQPEGASFAFKIDSFSLTNSTSAQEAKKIPITKIYGAMLKPIKKLQLDFAMI